MWKYCAETVENSKTKYFAKQLWFRVRILVKTKCVVYN